jgi:DNA-binding CsgD family transcriptional regulator
MPIEKLNKDNIPAPEGAGKSTLLGRGLEILNSRERMLFSLLASELSYAEIADQLDLSRSTIRSYSSWIANKLGLQGRKGIQSFAQSITEEAGEPEITVADVEIKKQTEGEWLIREIEIEQQGARQRQEAARQAELWYLINEPPVYENILQIEVSQGKNDQAKYDKEQEQAEARLYGLDLYKLGRFFIARTGEYMLNDDIIQAFSNPLKPADENLIRTKISGFIPVPEFKRQIAEEGLMLHKRKYTYFGRGRQRVVMVALPKDEEPSWPIFEAWETDLDTSGTEKKSTDMPDFQPLPAPYIHVSKGERSFRYRKRFDWEDGFENVVKQLLSKLAAAGVKPERLYPIEDESTLRRMLEGGLISEEEAHSGELPVNKLVRAFVLKTSEGKKIRPGFESRQRALRVIDELVESHKWKKADKG